MKAKTAMQWIPTRVLVFLAAVFLTLPAATAATGTKSAADDVLTALPKATWVADGRGRRAVYIFFDPNCPACQLLYRNLRGLIEPHELQVRWVPVAIVNATSLGKAAAILEAPDPAAALRENEERYAAEAYSGGIAEHLPSRQTELKVRANEHLLNKLDIPVVPTMLFADKDGRAVMIQGALSPLALRKVFKRLP